MWPDRVSNPGPLTLMSDALLTALRGPALLKERICFLRRKFFSLLVDSDSEKRDKKKADRVAFPERLPIHLKGLVTVITNKYVESPHIAKMEESIYTVMVGIFKGRT